MPKLQVFDQPMCCTTGICGPEVDPALVSFAADLQWLERNGVVVERINPAHQPALFAANEQVREELQRHGNGCLPLLLVDSRVVSRGVLPDRAQLAGWTGIPLGELPVLLPIFGSAPAGNPESSACCDSSGCC